jgi:hypothetical protein
MPEGCHPHTHRHDNLKSTITSGHYMLSYVESDANAAHCQHAAPTLYHSFSLVLAYTLQNISIYLFIYYTSLYY